jgi:ABC-type Mn2+/Zn2+ transport system permease subunit
MNSIETYIEIVEVTRPSLVTASALAVGASLVGVITLLRREALLALALPQVVAAGAAAGLRLNFPATGAAIGSVGAALMLVAWARRCAMAHVLLPCLYVGALSLSILLIANSQQHLHEMQHLLAGEAVFVTPEQARIVAPLIACTGIVAAMLWRRWLLLAQNPAAAQLAGLHPVRWDALFLVLLSTIAIAGTSASGIVMVLAMLLLPAGTVLPWARRIPHALMGAVAAALLYLLAGFVLSVEMEWPLSQSVGGAGFVGMLTSMLLRGTPGPERSARTS